MLLVHHGAQTTSKLLVVTKTMAYLKPRLSDNNSFCLIHKNKDRGNLARSLACLLCTENTKPRGSNVPRENKEPIQ